MAKTMVLVGGLMLAAVSGAWALSEWWTPVGKACPVFDSEEACETWCAAHQDKCGGASDCGFHTGSQQPDCALPVD